MKKNMTGICLLICLFVSNAVMGQYFSTYSNWFSMDTKMPFVSNWCPQEGTVYLPGQEVFLDYYIMERNLTTVQLGFSSEIDGDTLIIASLPANGPTTITIPQVETSTAKLYIVVSDSYGHVTYHPVPEFGYFGIGTAAQQVSVPQGWSGLSSVYVPQSPEIGNIFGENIDDVIIIQDLENIYWPGGNVFTLNEWDVMQGYLIKTENGFEMNFEGSTPQCDVSAGIDEGWDLIPIVAPCDIDAENFMNWYLWSSDMIKEAAGWRMYWPEYNINSLEVLEQGKAYFVHSWMENTDFLFGPCWEETKTAFNELAYTPDCWNKPLFTPASHIMAIPEEVMNEAGIGFNWTLGAFTTEGLCAGAAPAGAYHLTVFADDASTPVVDGMKTGEFVHIRAWNPTKQEEITLSAEFDENLPDQGFFAENGVSAIKKLKNGTTGIDRISDAWLNLYPNPANNNLMIETNITGKFQVEISDTKGAVLVKKELANNSRIDVSNLAEGVYTVKISNNNLIIIRKLLIN